MKTMKTNVFILIAAVLFVGCTDDDDTSIDTPIIANEEELITTVKLTFIDSSGLSKIFEFNDPDGEGGMTPTIDTIYLSRGISYNLSTKFFDRSDPNDVEDITVEIREEDDEHLICFESINISGLTIDIIDSDGTYELGLSSIVEVSDSASSLNGVLKLILKHQAGVKDGTCPPGETDVEVDFSVQFN